MGKEKVNGINRTPLCNTKTWRGTDALCSQRAHSPPPIALINVLQYRQEGTASPPPLAIIPVLFNYARLDIQIVNPCLHMASSLPPLLSRQSRP